MYFLFKLPKYLVILLFTYVEAHERRPVCQLVLPSGIGAQKSGLAATLCTHPFASLDRRFAVVKPMTLITIDSRYHFAGLRLFPVMAGQTVLDSSFGNKVRVNWRHRLSVHLWSLEMTFIAKLLRSCEISGFVPGAYCYKRRFIRRGVTFNAYFNATAGSYSVLILPSRLIMGRQSR